jgi:hypothetical protein
MTDSILTTTTPGDGEYALAPDVALVLAQDGTARLLDLGGSFFALSATAAAMLHESLQADQKTAAARVTGRYQAAPEQVESDLRTLLEQLERDGLVRRRGRPARPRRVHRLLASVLMRPLLRGVHALPLPVGLKARALLGLAYLGLRAFGLPATIAAWRGSPPQNTPSDPQGAEAAARAADDAVRAAASGHLFDTQCKERALACWSLLRARGLPARLVLGIDLYPFASHCWCELGGRVLTDYEDHCQRFTPVFNYA